MDEFEGNADAIGASLLVKQARRISRNNVFRAGLGVVSDFVVAHLGGDSGLKDTESPSKPAALVGTRRLDELDVRDQRQKILRLRELRLTQLARACQTEPAGDLQL